MVAAAVVAGLVVALPGAPAAFAASVPGMPEALSLPGAPVVGASGSVGYLPSSSSVSPSGQYTISIPLDVPAGRAGMQPALSLEYGGGSGDGYEGVGWSLAGASSSITRCATTLADGAATPSGVHFNWSDSFCLDGQKLVRLGAAAGDTPDKIANAEWRTQNDGFDKVTSSSSLTGSALGTAGGPDAFTVRLKDGRIRTYTVQSGTRSDTGVEIHNGKATEGDSTSSGAVRTVWLLTSETDRSANEVDYQYTVTADASGNEFQPSKITYTVHSDKNTPKTAQRYVDFVYESRPDASFGFVGGVKFKTSQRLKTVRMFAPNPAATSLVWQYNLTYGSDVSGRSLLSSVAKCGPAGGCSRSKTFTWDSSRANVVPSFTETDIGAAPVTWDSTSPSPAMRVADIDHDGVDDILFNGGRANADWVITGKRNANGSVSPLSQSYPMSADPVWPGTASVAGSFPLDLKGDGAGSVDLDYADPQSGMWHSKEVTWNAVTHQFADAGSDVQIGTGYGLADFNGDGLLDRGWQQRQPSSPTAGSLVVAIALNKGDGTFTAPMVSSFTVGAYTGTPGTASYKVTGSCGLPGYSDPAGDGKGSLIGQQWDASIGACTTDDWVLSLDASGSLMPPQWGSRSIASLGLTWHHVMPFVSGYRTVGGDFNGDGMEDYVLAPLSAATGTSFVLWNTGNGLALGPAGSLAAPDYASVQAADVDGDGRADLVEATAAGLWVYMSKGDGTFTGAKSIASDGGTWAVNGWSTTRFGDFDGTGRLGVARISGGHLKVSTQSPYFTDRITAVGDGGTAWNRESVTYSTAINDHDPSWGSAACSYPQVCLRHGMTVVRQVDSRAAGADPGAGKTPAPYSVFYSFEDPVSDVRGSGFLGFGTMRMWDPQRPAETTTSFSHRTQVDGRFYPYVDRPAMVTTAVPIMDLTGAGQKPGTATARATATHYTYEVRHLNAATTNYTYAVFPTSDYTKEWEQSTTLAWGSLTGTNASAHVGGVSEFGPATLKRTDASAEFDDYGNATHADRATTGGESQIVDTVFDNRTADWLISLPTQRTVHSISADQHSGVRHTSAHYDPQGRLDQSWVEQGGAADLASTTTYTIDAYGLVTGSKMSQANVPDRISHTEYNPVWQGQPDERVFPSQVWSEHSVASAQPSRWMAVQPGYGVTVATMDVNGVQTQATFDDLGRPVTTNADGQQSTSYTYANRNDTGGGTNGTVVTATTGAYITTTNTDALGRTLSAAERGFDGTMHTTTTGYDVLGRTAQTTAPAPGGTTKISYDSLDRPLVTTLPDNSQATSSYTFSTTSSTDATGKAKTDTTYTLDGEVAKTVRTDLSVNPAVTSNTSYTYSPFGQTHTVTDDKGHVTTLTYDTLGRRTILDDPNKGTTTDTYLATGELTGESHQATGVSTTFGGWDDLGRYTTKTTSPGGTSTFTWDTATNGIGRLARATSPDNIRTDYRYDTNGRTTGTDYTDTATGAVYSTDQSYDAQGRPDTLTYPAAGGGTARYAVKSGYNSYGHLATLTDVTTAPNTTLFTITARQPNQALDTATYGTGAHALTLKNTYDSGTGRLHNSKVTDAGAIMPLQDLTYGYDHDGQVTTRTDAVNTRQETYGYNGLGQLADWKLSLDGGQTNKDTAYGYDTIGDLTKITVNGATATTYTYGKADGSQPNTQTALTNTGQAAQNAVFDAKGRQTSGDGRTTTYTAFDLPKTVTINGTTTTFAYDAFGHKAKETGPAGTTFYIPGLFEHRVSGATTTDVYYLTGPDGPVGQAVTVNNNPATVEYTLTDHQGSTTTALTPGQTPNRYFHDPFGTAIKPDGTPTTPIGDVTHRYTGQEADPALNLINMNGRVYDPTQKQFLTTDPLGAPGTSPYAYVHNNPVNYTDPTGYTDCDAACQKWWDQYQGGQLNEFFGDAEAYGNGGPHALAQREISDFHDNAYGEYINHVRTDQERARQQAQNHNLVHQQYAKSDNTTNTTPGTNTSGDALPYTGWLRAYNEAMFGDERIADATLLSVPPAAAGICPTGCNNPVTPQEAVASTLVAGGALVAAAAPEVLTACAAYSSTCASLMLFFGGVASNAPTTPASTVENAEAQAVEAEAPAAAQQAAQTAAVQVAQAAKPALGSFEQKVYSQAAASDLNDKFSDKFIGASAAVSNALKQINPEFDVHMIGEYAGQPIIGSLKSHSGIVSVNGVIQIVKMGEDKAYHIVGPFKP